MNSTAAKERLSADFRMVMDDIDKLMKAGGTQAEAEMSSLRDRIGERLDAAKERAADVQEEALARARQAAHATDDYVRGHPWQAMGAAAALGLALGVLIGRR
jgi:ElaB/YqjD/DUF883 family membrane-anchored ribosome-binding protein